MNTLMTSNHPRLWFNAEQLKALRESAKTGMRARVLARLRYLCERLLTPGHAMYLDYRERTSDHWRVRHGSFRIMPSIIALSAGYAFTGEERFGDAARDAFMVIIDHGVADAQSLAHGTPNSGWRHGPGHDKGKFARMTAAVYDLCYDRFTDEQRCRIADYARDSIKFAGEFSPIDAAHIANNRGIRGLAVKPWLYAAMSGDFDPRKDPRNDPRNEDSLSEDPRKVFENALYHLDMHLFLTIDAQGAPYEGPGYAGALTGSILLAEAIRRQGYADLTGHNRFERLLDYFVYQLVPGGGTADNVNDADPPCGSALTGLPLMGSANAATLPWLIEQLDLHPTRNGDWLDNRQFDINDEHISGLIMMLLWWRDDVPVKSPVELGYPTSYCFRTRGIAALRTGWDRTDWLVSHLCGRQERTCHRQGDYNHISLYAEGEHFLADAGYGRHANDDPTQALDRWFTATDAHNCVMIDGQLFRDVFNNLGWCDGDMLDFQETADFVTSLGDASGCMGKDHQVRRSLRRVVLVRGGPATYLAVIDLVENDGHPFNATATWQTAVGQSISLSDGGFTIHGKARNCTAHVLHPTNVTLSLREHHALPQVRVDLRASVAEIVTVFCPVPLAGNQPMFTCTRTGEGAFEITCECNGKRSILHASAAIQPPLRRPEVVRFEA